MPHVLAKLRGVVSHPTFVVCVAVGIAGAAMDLDHLAEGFARQTHLLVAVAACCGFGLHLALGRRRRRAVVLGVRA